MFSDFAASFQTSLQAFVRTRKSFESSVLKRHLQKIRNSIARLKGLGAEEQTINQDLFNMKLVLAVFALLVANLVHGDMYLHNPRGSNNRLNEDKAARTNANRLFNSQVSINRIIVDNYSPKAK